MRFLSFLILVFAVLELVQAQDQSGFISLDCGLVPKETTYVEKSTNITYRSDATFIDSGFPGKISEVYRTQLQQQTWALRSFPEGQRNCYNFTLTAKRKYLIRGTFIYGNYDGLNRLPSFDLYIGPNKWTSVSIPGVTNGSVNEMIHVLTQDRLQICLVKTGETTPFISSLELRPLNNNTYVTQSGSLIAVARVYFSPTPPFVRFDEDVHDRIWVPLLDNKTSLLSTELSVDTSNFYNVPQAVAKTAAVPENATQPLTIDWTLDDITASSYIYMHFAEIQNLEANATREFNITYNGGKNWYSYFRPPKFSITTIYNPAAVSSLDGNFNFTFSMTRNSTLPPLINGLEIYQVLDLLQLDTDQDEVSAMMKIKSTYGLSKRSSWQGDPCAPELYRWEGLNCSYSVSEPPRIISMNLSGSNLSGTITSDISKLTRLRELDLSNNDLSGEIPGSFSLMTNLTLINLSGNKNLNRSVPEALQKRINSKSLILIRDETRENSKNVVAIAASVASVFAVLVILAIVFFVIRKKQRANEASGPASVTRGTVKSDARSSSSSIITKERKFTYSEVLKMTKNFERVLGKGGFGTVYHGDLEDTQVAVKMLSHSSAQGYKEFKAEVELLLRVHHRHLVGLVGYCDDGDNLALIYEYMANGDLRENMSGKRSVNVLSWETRMQIAVEAAQGLEYLHNGCRPPMVHRDVKPTNILLNERSQAKLADFGLSRSFPVDGESHVMTVVAGTPGYLDPEYYRTNWLSEKSDVYSFGVVLLEIVTNQPVINKNRERPHINEWVGFMLTNGDIRSIVDPKLMDDYDTNGVWKVVELALACVNPSSSRRPTMPHVVMELNECLAMEIERKQDTQVAVKMLSHSSAQGYKEFKAEVELLLRVHHRHLVGLVGYCDDGDNLALIYEYMANGDLRENMSGKRSVNVLSWETRMQIAVEAAQGLEYLHNGCRPPMVHRDVKPTNILLNERSQAKLADFGLSRSFPVDGESHVMTVVAGTPGYLDPEYYRTNWLSEKSDVYSFGVVLLEIVTNQPVINKNRERPHINDWVGFMLTNGDIRSIVDPKLMNDYDTNGVWKVVELALACVNPSSSHRPTMPYVVMELNECLALEIERKQGSQATYSKGSVEFSPSFASDFSPLAR